MKLPTYNRQRFLLLLLNAAGGSLSKLDLQKLAFLYGQETGSGHYSFVPYKFGCYSFQAADDLSLLEKQGWVELSSKQAKLQIEIQRFPTLSGHSETRQISEWLGSHHLRGRNLIREVYRNYPWFAIRSEIKEDILSETELSHVDLLAKTAKSGSQSLFTLGYEGITFEEYANKLLKNGVRLLCDIRANPLSRKFGFSKSALSRLLPQLGIKYVHLPELGIASNRRKGLSDQNDYRNLFSEYRSELTAKEAELSHVYELLAQNNRIALTCFEELPHSCHRHCVSDYLQSKHGIRVMHL